MTVKNQLEIKVHFFLSTVRDQNVTVQLWTARELDYCTLAQCSWRFELECSCDPLQREQSWPAAPQICWRCNELKKTQTNQPEPPKSQPLIWSWFKSFGFCYVWQSCSCIEQSICLDTVRFGEVLPYEVESANDVIRILSNVTLGRKTTFLSKNKVLVSSVYLFYWLITDLNYW